MGKGINQKDLLNPIQMLIYTNINLFVFILNIIRIIVKTKIKLCRSQNRREKTWFDLLVESRVLSVCQRQKISRIKSTR